MKTTMVQWLDSDSSMEKVTVMPHLRRGRWKCEQFLPCFLA